MKFFIQLLFFVSFVTFSPELTAQTLDTKQAALPCLNKTFSVVAHITRDSMGELNTTPAAIQEGIDSVNAKFAPICVSFEICEFNIIDNFQYDDIAAQNYDQNDWDEMLVKFHRTNRINIFFVTTASFPDMICGFSDVEGLTATEPNGIVVLKNCVTSGSMAIAHEMGHYFGLLDTFEGNGSELVDGSNCTTEGDLICDTPADPFVIGDDPVNYVDVALGCRFISEKRDANGTYFEPEVGNIMSEYQDICRCGFTHQQFQKMAEVCRTAAGRVW